MNSLGLACMRISRLSARRCCNQRCRLTSASKPCAPASAEAAHTPVDVDDTHFGFQQVPSEQKKGMVKGVFTSVAHNYDVMNDLMSAGMHRIWKDAFVDMLQITPGFEAGSPAPKVLDVAGGTGDIAFRVADQLRPYMAGSPAGEATQEGEGQGEVQQDGAVGDAIDSNVPLLTVSDINPDMLEVGEQRAADRFSPEILTNMQFVQADAEALPFEDNSFHLYTIAFGLRNVTEIDKALREAHRVLKPGGRFMCLEFSRVPIEPLQKAYDWYSFNVIPTIGQVVAKDRDAYQYLVESIRMFPGQEELEERMSSAGFKVVSHCNLTAGVVAVHSGFKMSRRRPTS
ncbi:unnamed protein product [Ectocarpus sp. 12 AP-2014]